MKKNPWKESAGVYHTYDTEQTTKEKQAPAGFIQREEADKDTRLGEIFHMANAFGQVSLGVNEKKEAVFTVSRKRDDDRSPAEEDAVSVKESRAKTFPHRNGKYLVNPRMVSDGAFTFSAKPGFTIRKFFNAANDFQKKEGQETVEEFLPFAGPKRDMEEVSREEKLYRNALEKGVDRETLDAMEREREQNKQERAKKLAIRNQIFLEAQKAVEKHNEKAKPLPLDWVLGKKKKAAGEDDECEGGEDGTADEGAAGEGAAGKNIDDVAADEQ